MESSSSNGNQTSTLPIARSRHQVAMKSLWCISQYSKRNQPSVSELRPPPFNPDKLPVRKPLPKKLQELMNNDEEDVVTVVRLTTTYDCFILLSKQTPSLFCQTYPSSCKMEDKTVRTS